MNDYSIGDLAVGMTESFNVTMTAEMMDMFLRITGDTNPMHLESEYATNRGFSDKIVYGMLTASLISTLGGCYLPGKKCLIQGIEIKFTNPVYEGDRLTVVGEVAAVHIEVCRVDIKVTIKNQKGKKVLRGKLMAGVLDAR